MENVERDKRPFDFSNLRDPLTIIFKHKKKVLVVFMLIFIMSILLGFFILPIYEAKSTLLVKLGREFIQKPETGGGGFSIPDSIMKAEMNILQSQDAAERVVDTVGIYTIYPWLGKSSAGEFKVRQIAVRSLREQIMVSAYNGIITISFAHPNPLIAAKTVNTLVDVLMEKHLQVFGVSSTEFLENQQKVYQDKLKESEQKLAQFKAKNQVFSPEDQKSALIEQRVELDSSLKAAQSQLSELQQKLVFIRGPKWLPDMATEMRAQLTSLQQREREALQKYNEGSKHVQNIRQEIQALKDTYKNNTSELREVEAGKVEGEMSVVKARQDSLRYQLQQVDSEIRSVDSRGQELQTMKRDAAQQEQNYQIYAKKLEDSRIMDDMDRRKMVAISVIEKATTPLFPKKPKLGRRRLIAGGLTGGALSGIALAFLLELLSPAMTTPMSAERRLGLHVMVAVARKA